ncbi:DeoR/GlpR transcriptional regulator, partial [Burkholderia pseudomallei]
MHVSILVHARYTARMNEAIPLARRDAIAGRLALGQPVQAAALAAEFHVSEDAIRR